MQISDVLAANLGGITDPTAAASTASNTIDRNDFLNLLVAQLQNQDPLNPMESAEFSSQLAQFSSLEQLIEINDGIKTLGGEESSGQLDALGLLGHQVRAVSGEVSVVGGEHSEISYDLPSAGSVEVQIASGGVSLGSFSLGDKGAGTHTLDLAELDGLPPLSDGNYTVTLRTTVGDGASQTIPTWVLGQVTGVDLNDGKPVLLLGSRQVSVSDVREVRSASHAADDGSEPEDSPEGSDATGPNPGA